MHAYANPVKRDVKYGPNDKGAAGHGIVRFNKKTRKITMECWPRNVDVSNPQHKQFPGWPKTIDQQKNYNRTAKAWLPTIKHLSARNPVVQVINEKNNAIVYTIRINGSEFTPKVFEEGTYTIKVGGQGACELRTFKNIKSSNMAGSATLEIK